MELSEAGNAWCHLFPSLAPAYDGKHSARGVPSDEELDTMEAILAHRSGSSLPSGVAGTLVEQLAQRAEELQELKVS
jgi:hypothetical protein